jgi:hypothetical protein
MLSPAMVFALAWGTAAAAQETKPPDRPNGDAPEVSTGYLQEPRIFTMLMNASDRTLLTGRDRDEGFYVELGNMITGSGWISAGPGYRWNAPGDRLVVDVSGALSSNLYKVAQGRVEAPGLLQESVTIGAQAMYQDLMEVDYFGVGAQSVRSDRRSYRLRNTDVLGYVTIRPARWLSVDGRLGWIDAALTAAGASGAAVRDAVFADGAGRSLSIAPSFVHADVSISADWRDQMGHPTRGGLYRASAATYADAGGFGAGMVRRYQVEGSQFVPLTRNWILALHGWAVFSDPSNGPDVPFYLMPSLGGDNTLRGYNDYRFHDNDMQSFNIESRWALVAHVDLAVFIDAGKVAPRAGDLDFTHLKTSYGMGFRVHNRAWTLGRMDIGHSAEGWRIFFQVSDPFNRSTPASGRTSVVPFVP